MKTVVNVYIHDSDFGRLIIPASIHRKAKLLGLKLRKNGYIYDKRYRGGRYLETVMTKIAEEKWRKELSE